MTEADRRTQHYAAHRGRPMPDKAVSWSIGTSAGIMNKHTAGTARESYHAWRNYGRIDLRD